MKIWWLARMGEDGGRAGCRVAPTLLAGFQFGITSYPGTRAFGFRRVCPGHTNKVAIDIWNLAFTFGWQRDTSRRDRVF